MIVLRYVLIGLQLLLLTGAYVLKRLYSTKMGVMRHMVMLSNKWRAAYNPELTFSILALLLIGIGLWKICSLGRKRLPWQRALPWSLLVLLAFSFLLFMWLTRDTGVHVNVVLLPLLGIVLVLQLLLCIISHRNMRN